MRSRWDIPVDEAELVWDSLSLRSRNGEVVMIVVVPVDGRPSAPFLDDVLARDERREPPRDRRLAAGVPFRLSQSGIFGTVSFPSLTASTTSLS